MSSKSEKTPQDDDDAAESPFEQAAPSITDHAPVIHTKRKQMRDLLEWWSVGGNRRRQPPLDDGEMD